MPRPISVKTRVAAVAACTSSTFERLHRLLRRGERHAPIGVYGTCLLGGNQPKRAAERVQRRNDDPVHTGLRKHERDPRVAPARAVVVLEPGVEPRTLHHQYASNASETNIDREGLPRVSLEPPQALGRRRYTRR